MDQNGKTHEYVVIIAGGTGTRLWPLSRKGKPKQFQTLFSAQTLLMETYRRAAMVVPEENIFVASATEYRSMVMETLPDFDEKRLILEPAPRGTAGAIALVAHTMHRLDPEAIVATLASDHAIKNDPEFVLSIRTALEIARKQKHKLVIVGINPTYPSTELGYIKMGTELENADSFGKRVFTVHSFKEKPDRKTAETYLAGWEYLWNAGYFIFDTASFLEMVRKHIPNTFEAIEEMASADENDPNRESTMARIYDRIETEPIDTALVEKLLESERIVVPSELQWSDIGNWKSLYDFLNGEDSSGSSLVARGEHVDVGSKNCFIHSNKKLVATLCLDDIVIVDTDDALLVAKKDCAQDVKKILDILRAEGKKQYL